MNMQAKLHDNAGSQIRENIAVHDRISSKYAERHGEIFNEIEQERLRAALTRAISYVTTGSRPLAALDFGCGSGNLTRHLLDLDLKVVASDVSEGFLAIVREQFRSRAVSTIRLNGKDLSEIESESFDIVATYSVLHHVPDYLAAVREMARVCKSGGVIFLDHEPTEDYWSDNARFASFRSQAMRFDWRKFLVWGNYVGKFKRLLNPRYANEGDVHVWPDDHIEWTRIESLLRACGCEVILAEDYLLYRRGYYKEVYERYQTTLADTRLMVFRKL